MTNVQGAKTAKKAHPKAPKTPELSPAVFIAATSTISPQVGAMDADCNVLLPVITIEKTGTTYDVSARFSLQIGPNPRYTTQESNVHAKFLDTIDLEYLHKAGETNSSDPSPGSCTLFNVVKKSNKKREGEAGVTASQTPGATFRLNVLKEQSLELTYASTEWRLNVAQNLPLKAVNAPLAKKKKTSLWQRVTHLFAKKTKKTGGVNGAAAVSVTSPNDAITRVIRPTLCTRIQWESTSSELNTLHAAVLNFTRQTITITRHIPAHEFLLRADSTNEMDGKALAELAEAYFHFYFHVEVLVRELDRGGFRASMDRIHQFRPEITPEERYSHHGNPGMALNPRTSFEFTIQPEALTEEKIKEMRSLLPGKTLQTQSVQTALNNIRRDYPEGNSVPKKLPFDFYQRMEEDAETAHLTQTSLATNNYWPSEEGLSRDGNLTIAFF